MATANTALRVTELDFDSIKANLKDFLRSQSEFQDFDFEGSGMSVLLDILAYNTHYMGYYLNMVANEMFIDTAQLRNSALSHAKMLGYTPGSRTGSQAVVNITVTPSSTEDQLSTQLTIDKYSRFLGTDNDGINYNFLTTSTNTAIKTNSSFTFSNVTIRQGEVVTRQYLMDPTNTKRRFSLPSANVDIATVTVTVQDSISNTSATVYSLSEDITENTNQSTIYFLEENSDSTYTIYFGDDVIGKKPKNGSVINITYLDTAGAVSNNIPRFSTVSGIGQYSDNVIVTTVQSSYGGRDKETIDQIKFRAPNYYSTQNRAVTKNDYETLIVKDFSNIDSVAVWGGEENIPPVYGKVYIALKTVNNYFLSNLEKERIKNTLIRNRNVLTVTPEIVDPDYTFLLIRGTVTYNPSATNLSQSDLTAFARAAVLDYETAELNTFKSTFRKSKLQTYVESADKSFTGSDVKVYLQKRIDVNTNIEQKYTINANFPIKKGDFNNKIYSFPAVNVYDNNSVLRSIFFEEVPSALTGINSIDIVNPGINFTSVPTITITGDGTGAKAIATVVGGRISSVKITDAGQNYTRATVTISGGGGTEAILVAKLQSKIGVLRTYYLRSNGEKIILNSSAGNIDYESGLIEINNIRVVGTVENDFYPENVLTFNLPIDSEIIPPLRNRIVTIDQNDPISVQFSVLAES